MLTGIREALEIFAEVLAVDPLTAILFLFGNVLLLGSIAVFGILSAGAFLSLRRGLHG